jgi:8-oxo-dGTP pyrophosphatase MutT (NUDIX family)
MELPISASVVVVVENDGRFLLIEEERGKPQGRVWYFPAGALEVGESLAAAARREVLEETGYTVEPGELIQIDHGRFGSYPDLPWWRLAIAARLTGAEPVVRLDEDVVAVDWLTLDEIAQRTLRCGDAVDLALRCQSGAGLPLAACRLAPDGRLAGFFD